MTTILAPIDFSNVSERVVEAAMTLAKAFSGRVVLLNVVQPPVITTEYGVMMENVQELVSVTEQAATRQLATLQQKFNAPGVQLDVAQQTGSAVPLILDQARTLGAAYIVMGSHGHTAFYDLLVGSTASGVVKDAPCPVVVIPPLDRAKKG